MSALGYVGSTVIPAAYKILPPAMASHEATAMLIAIGLQESRFIHRKQIGGPAMGFWQFESGGGWRGVIRHHSTAVYAQHVLKTLGYDGDPGYEMLERDDILACCFARLLLYTLPGRLPGRFEKEEGWRQYISAWRPGKPHPETWEAFFEQAWASTGGG